jgi:hypothetical protein
MLRGYFLCCRQTDFIDVVTGLFRSSQIPGASHVLARKKMLCVSPSTGTKSARKTLVWSLLGTKNDQYGLPGQVLRSSSEVRGRIKSSQQKSSQRNCGDWRKVGNKERRWRSRDYGSWMKRMDNSASAVRCWKLDRCRYFEAAGVIRSFVKSSVIDEDGTTRATR